MRYKDFTPEEREIIAAMFLYNDKVRNLSGSDRLQASMEMSAILRGQGEVLHYLRDEINIFYQNLEMELIEKNRETTAISASLRSIKQKYDKYESSGRTSGSGGNNTGCLGIIATLCFVFVAVIVGFCIINIS